MYDENDHFWNMHNDERDFEYFHINNVSFSGISGGFKHPVYWTVVAIITILISIISPGSQGIPLMFLALAFSFSFCL